LYYQNNSDETLVMLTLAGEQSAYEVLVNRYQKAVVASAISVTKNQYMAEDAAQDAFVTAWMKLNTLQDQSKFGAWVCRISKNCALNMIGRYRSYLPLDVVENLNVADDSAANPAELYALSDEHDEVNKSIEKLPKRVRQIIQMHYFEGLSIAEIADKLRISEGTVKWQFHDGRKRIRKELCAMNEKYNDTLLQRVMKKVEELKNWQVINDKTGFEKVYNAVLRDIEELPESNKKDHALADVLVRGWWWLPGKQNDELFARITEAAIASKNEEVMTFITTVEDSKLSGDAKINFMLDKQIPRLEKYGFVKALAREWLWLGRTYCIEEKYDKAFEAIEKSEKILETSDVYSALIFNAKKWVARLREYYKDKKKKHYIIQCLAEELHYIDGMPRYWVNHDCGTGYLSSVNHHTSYIFRNSSMCDGHYFADIKVGETFVGSDGTTLTFASDNEMVATPAGIFEGCQLWITKYWYEYEGKTTCKSYYKDGVGIVKHERVNSGITDIRVLKSYNIKGGKGLLPFYRGNSWEYVAEYTPETIVVDLKYEVTFANEEKVIISGWDETERLKYDENSWIENIRNIRNEYCNSNRWYEWICDVSPAIERAEKLAKTSMEKAHTKAAASVARRIMATDVKFSPDSTTTGHWNFFARNEIRNKNGTLTIQHNGAWSFEWKITGNLGIAGQPVLYNDIYGILQDATNCIWSGEWRIGASPIVEYTQYDRNIKTQITCTDSGTVTTKAGTFDNCLKLSLDISGMTDGWNYRGGNKVYYFADGIGIVRIENEYCGGTRTAVYELTSYEGKGEGYMPMTDGLVRRYDAIGLTDGFVGSAVYTYVADSDGDIIIFSDRTGIRETPPPITLYSAIQDEMLEDKLWNSDNHKESRVRHDVNNFHLICHFFGRPSRYWARPDKGVAWNKYKLNVMEGLNMDGKVPDAWLGLYAITCFRTACASFGVKDIEEGYKWLDKAFEVFPEWEKFSNGDELDVGHPLIYGGIKLIKGKDRIKLPDGREEPITYDWMFNEHISTMYYGLTAKHGWEWFDCVRNEERYKKYVDRAKELAK